MFVVFAALDPLLGLGGGDERGDLGLYLGQGAAVDQAAEVADVAGHGSRGFAPDLGHMKLLGLPIHGGVGPVFRKLDEVIGLYVLREQLGDVLCVEGSHGE